MVSSWCGTEPKEAPEKERPFPAALKLITGRRQTEWTGATRCPNKGHSSHRRESLINRIRTILFRLRLPCRPLAECLGESPRPRHSNESSPRTRGIPNYQRF